MNIIISSRLRTLTTRRDEILFESTVVGSKEHDVRLLYINRQILREIDDTLNLARRWSDEPLSIKYVHHQVFPAGRRMAA